MSDDNGVTFGSLWRRTYDGLKQFQEDHEPGMRVAELLLVVFAFGLSIKAGCQQEAFESNMLERLETLNESFAQVDSSLNMLPHKMEVFSEVVESLSENVLKQDSVLQLAMFGLENSVVEFDSSLGRYSNAFSELARVNQNQIEIMDKQHEALAEQLLRKSELRAELRNRKAISEDTLGALIWIRNHGNWTSSYCSITITIPRGVILESTGFTGLSGFSGLKTDSSRDRQFTHEFPNFHIAPVTFDSSQMRDIIPMRTIADYSIRLIGPRISTRDVAVDYMIFFDHGMSQGKMISKP